MPFPVGILTVSDKCSKGLAADTSGPAVKELLESQASKEDWVVVATRIVPDSKQLISDTVKSWCISADSAHGPLCRLVVITGGTGISPSDVTISAIEPLFSKPLPSLATAMVVGSLKITPFAALSQVAAGVVGEAVVLAVPGSKKGSVENVQQVVKVLPHAVSTAMATSGTRHLHSEKGTPIAHPHDKHKSGEEAAAPLPERRKIACGCGRIDDETAAAQSAHDKHTHSHLAAQGLSNDLNEGVSRRARKSPYPMIPVGAALEHVLSSLSVLDPVDLPLSNVREGQILAEDVIARENVPAFRASIMDGYAVKASDGPGTYKVRGSSVAGGNSALVTEEHPLQLGEIVRIATGAPVPPGADAVVMVEDTVLVESRKVADEEETEEEVLVNILDSGKVAEGQHIRPVGHDMKLGSVVLSKGSVITSVGGEIGTLAISGNSSFRVYTLPKIAVMSTGDEVVDTLGEAPATEQLRHGAIRDSNRPALLAALAAVGCETVDLGVAKDDPDTLAAIIKKALAACHGIITTGGVSMGERDWLKPVVEQRLGGKIMFGRVAMKPSKPTTFATIPHESGVDKFILALPGNPVSALVAFHMFAAPALRKMAGHLLNIEAEDGDARQEQIIQTLRPNVEATFDSPEIWLDQVRPEYVRGMLMWKHKEGAWSVRVIDRHQQSSRMASMQSANALIALPRGSSEKQTVKQGEKVTVIVIASPHL